MRRRHLQCRPGVHVLRVPYWQHQHIQVELVHVQCRLLVIWIRRGLDLHCVHRWLLQYQRRRDLHPYVPIPEPSRLRLLDALPLTVAFPFLLPCHVGLLCCRPRFY